MSDTESDPDPKEFVPHKLEWSPEHVRRFWDWLSTNPAMEHLYFARILGKSLIDHVGFRVGIGTAVDIGCGRGDLIDVLIESGHDAYGVDQSPASVEQVKRRFARRRRFKGAALFDDKIHLDDASIDTGFIIEVVEHLDDESLAAVLTEAHRIIRPGGHLVLTTPNEEDLGLSETMCPGCGNVYHRMQHVRSWSANALSSHVAGFGFTAVSAQATILSPYRAPLGWVYRLAFWAVRRQKPHLIYIGRRL